MWQSWFWNHSESEPDQAPEREALRPRANQVGEIGAYVEVSIQFHYKLALKLSSKTWACENVNSISIIASTNFMLRRKVLLTLPSTYTDLHTHTLTFSAAWWMLGTDFYISLKWVFVFLRKRKTRHCKSACEARSRYAYTESCWMIPEYGMKWHWT